MSMFLNLDDLAVLSGAKKAGEGKGYIPVSPAGAAPISPHNIEGGERIVMGCRTPDGETKSFKGRSENVAPADAYLFIILPGNNNNGRPKLLGSTEGYLLAFSSRKVMENFFGDLKKHGGRLPKGVPGTARIIPLREVLQGGYGHWERIVVDPQYRWMKNGNGNGMGHRVEPAMVIDIGEMPQIVLAMSRSYSEEGRRYG